MLYGLYLSAQGAQAQTTQLDVTANNIANAGTTAFKRDLALFQSHRTHELHPQEAGVPPGNLDGLTGGVTVRQTVTDFSQAALTKTEGPLDLAISGPGFFRVTDGEEELLTRNGGFTKNTDGELVTADGGLRVLSEEGKPFRLDPDATAVTVTADGTVSERLPSGEVNLLGRLAVSVPVPATALEKRGNGLYRPTADTVPADPALTRVAQGFAEESGVNPVSETLRMIEASRAFETNVNMMKLQDESLGRLLTMARP